MSELGGRRLDGGPFPFRAAPVGRMMVDGRERGGADDEGGEANCFSHLGHRCMDVATRRS
jgi:hypothetical protein